MADKYIIYDPDTGNVVYMGGRPAEPLTPKKQALVDSGYEIKRVVIPSRRELPSDLEFVRVKDGKLERKTDAEIAKIKASREKEEAEAEKDRLRQLKSDLETV